MLSSASSRRCPGKEHKNCTQQFPWCCLRAWLTVTSQPRARWCQDGCGGEWEHARPGITHQRPFPGLFLMKHNHLNAEISVIYCQEHEKARGKKKKKSGNGGRGREGHSSFFLLTPLAAFGYRISLNGNLHAAFIFKPLIAF